MMISIGRGIALSNRELERFANDSKPFSDIEAHKHTYSARCQRKGEGRRWVETEWWRENALEIHKHIHAKYLPHAKNASVNQM